MNENNNTTNVDKYPKTKKVLAFFNKFIYKTKKITNTGEALKLRKKLLVCGTISFSISIIIIILSILGFIFMSESNYSFVLPLIVIILGFIILAIAIILLYIGLVILVTGEVTKHFDETKI